MSNMSQTRSTNCRNVAFAALALFVIVGCTRSQESFQVDATKIDKQFEQEGLVLVKFGAPWCGPCQQLDVELDTLVPQANGKAKIIAINIDEEPGMARRYNVTSIPRLMLFQNGVKVHDSVGYVQADEMLSWIDNAVAAPIRPSATPQAG